MCESMAGASNYVLLPRVAGCTFSLSFCRTSKSVFMLLKDVKVFTDWTQFIRRQSDTQRSVSNGAPKYPAQDPGAERSQISGRDITCLLTFKGLRRRGGCEKQYFRT